MNGYPAFQSIPYGYPQVQMPTMPSGYAQSFDVSNGASMIGRPSAYPLANGARGVFQQASNQQQSCLSVQFPIGPSTAGFRMLLGEMLLNGSYATKAILNQAEANGLSVVPTHAGDKVQFNFVGPAGKEQALIQLALQILTRPNLEGGTFNKQKADLITEVRKQLLLPEVPVIDAVGKGLYGNTHPYGKTTAEALEELNRMTPESMLWAYQSVIGQPQQASISMVSAQPVEVQQQLVNQEIQAFTWYASPYPQPQLPQAPAVPPAVGSPAPILIPNQSAERAHIVKAWRAPTIGDPDYPAFCLLMKMLGGMTGGFFRIMRTENGLVYSTHQIYQPHRLGADYQVMAQVDFDKLGKAMDAFKQVTGEFLNGYVSPDKLASSKKTFLLELMGDAQASERINHQNLPWMANDQMPPHPKELEQAIRSVTVQDIYRVAHRVFNPANGFEVTGVSAPPQVLARVFQQRV